MLSDIPEYLTKSDAHVLYFALLLNPNYVAKIFCLSFEQLGIQVHMPSAWY